MEYEAGLRKTMETCTAELDNGERIQVRFSDGYAFILRTAPIQPAC